MLCSRDAYVIASLYELIPQQCHTCGFRCHSADEMSAHLDYHFKLSTREVRRSTLRLSQSIHQPYYWPEDEWLTADDVVFQTKHRMNEEKTDEDVDAEGDEEAKRGVQADEAQTNCPVCQDPFTTEWDDDEEAWVYRGALRVRAGDEDEEEEREVKVGKKRGKEEAEKVRLKRRAVHAEYDGKILHYACYQSLLASASAAAPQPKREVDNGEGTEADDSLPPLEAVDEESGGTKAEPTGQ